MKETFRYPVLEVEFDRPQSGYWDFGKKSGGTFEPEIVAPSIALCDIEKKGFPKVQFDGVHGNSTSGSTQERVGLGRKLLL